MFTSVMDGFMAQLDLIMAIFETERELFGYAEAYKLFLKRNDDFFTKHGMIETMTGEQDLAVNITLLSLSFAALVLCFGEVKYDTD